MRFKFIAIFAMMVFVAGCESASETGGQGSGAGAGTGAAANTGGNYVAGSQEQLVAEVGDRVFFGFDQYDLDMEARTTLARQAAFLKANPSVAVSVEGHADERGTREYNLALGDRRANAVKDYLVALGINAGRIKTISYGMERPVALGSNEAAWAQNRRSVTVVGAAGS